MRTVLQRKAGGTMRHIPYGYRIENGRAAIDETQAATVRELFQNYISGMALMPAAEKVGLNLYHGSAGRMLRIRSILEMITIRLLSIKKPSIRQKKYAGAEQKHWGG